MTNSRTYKLTLVALMTALTAVSAYIRIPTPITPVTLQCEMVIFGALLWGHKVALSATVLYTVMGLAGIPVFAGGGGIHYIMTPTFGYLLGFIACAGIVGKFAQGKRTYPVVYLGLGIIYAVGIGYMYVLTNFILKAPVSIGIIGTASVITLPIDTILTFFAVKTSKKLSRR